MLAILFATVTNERSVGQPNFHRIVDTNTADFAVQSALPVLQQMIHPTRTSPFLSLALSTLPPVLVACSPSLDVAVPFPTLPRKLETAASGGVFYQPRFEAHKHFDGEQEEGFVWEQLLASLRDSRQEEQKRQRRTPSVTAPEGQNSRSEARRLQDKENNDREDKDANTREQYA
ncbi:hypothetical protein HPB47_023186 [Ixodes persulcatus]|uniref:Uncharacterized protein n=1 Tax=Ixodes persulcatus TaxID=34615 RepID=A0AC60Q822_IXOPE|nr:hypothetical protein HPB47_023186 [Ixodes persulcatus]